MKIDHSLTYQITFISLFTLSVTWAGDPPQQSKLRITNHCDQTIWVQQDFAHHTNDKIVEKIDKGAFHDYVIPEIGLSSTRFWPKQGCNEYGYDCTLGESVGVDAEIAAGHQHGPYWTDMKVQGYFAPGIDSKLEATWGCSTSIYSKTPEKCALNPSDLTKHLDSNTWWNGSAVDGYTLPFRINIKNHQGSCRDAQHGDNPVPNPGVDCSGLDMSMCPIDEDLSTKNAFDIINKTPVNSVNLQFKHLGDGNITGCFSPCSKLTLAQGSRMPQDATGKEIENMSGGWANILGGLTPSSPAAQMYCCPTPPVSPEDCRAGPASNSSYLHSVQEKQHCPIYTYAYDDASGLGICSAETQFEVIFCPTNSDADAVKK